MANAPYSAVARNSQETSRVHFNADHRDSESAADIEDNDIFDSSANTIDAMEVADNDTLYYGMSLGTRRKLHKVMMPQGWVDL
ncbi:hypothetical protein LPJ66_008903 [Kickxella alabastrina]|uniref:Uncharacterized protein n=1 Tax=Kickxella alabastrina TaxID=61397 RepID=A0ACC1I790_9FUNG|nr:hypothetical protein LPJ66_008903 [Kickxella alabastrina]